MKKCADMSYAKVYSFVIIFSLSCSVFKCSLDDLDNFINPEDIDFVLNIQNIFTTSTTTKEATTTGTTEEYEDTHRIKYVPLNLTETSDCFGLGSIMSKFKWFVDLTPQHSDEIQVEFFFQCRKNRDRVQIVPDDQFGLDWTSFDPKKTTIVIVHGFLSYSKASWVVNMTKAFLDWDDVNIFTVDWSKGGKTWKYWRAVANTRTVGSDLSRFLSQVIKESGASTDDFHFVGHSLGAHICAYAANMLGGVRRITGLDPAQPCFITTDLRMLLDKSDADFVDVIHTNGRELHKLGLGVPGTCGDQDFYPNGGRKQPGCYFGKSSMLNKLLPISRHKMERAVCNHGRAYKLFTESLKQNNCTLVGHKWDLSNSTINASISVPCNEDNCSELGIRADQYNATGAFYVVTTDKKPYCEIILPRRNKTSVPNSEEPRSLETTTLFHNESSSTEKPKKKWFFWG